MRTFCFLATAACLALAGHARPADLTTIDRTLRKQPAFQSAKPQFCLLVFGPEATTRVWAAFDGDVLYLDRNGNGDLTEPGERIAAREVYRNLAERPDVEVMRFFELECWKSDAEPVLSCGPRVQWFYVCQLIPREDYPDRDWVEYYREKPFDIAVTTTTGREQRARLGCAERPQDAPVLHFDGPRRFELSDKFGPIEFRPGETSELVARLTTPGVKATVVTDHLQVPPEVHPIAELEWPPGAGGGPIRSRVELKERC